MKNYQQLIRNVQDRTNPDYINESVLLNKSFSSELREVNNKKVLEYIKRAMHGVEPTYTERTIQTGNKVKAHLKDESPSLTFRYQGSVMTNTHIKGHSDIDLVQITNSFYSHDPREKFKAEYEKPVRSIYQKTRLSEVINANYYFGDANGELKRAREKAEEVLKRIYKNVLTEKPKSIEVETTSPKRKIDVVTASWYKNVESVLTGDEIQQGIQIYDKVKHSRLPVDYPFLKIQLLNDKNKSVNGRLKKMIRFIKNLKVDSENEIKLSSFDICSICYNIGTYQYSDKIFYELVIVLFQEFQKIIVDSGYRNSIKSIDGTEFIFKGKEDKLQNLTLLYRELYSVHEDLIETVSTVRFL